MKKLYAHIDNSPLILFRVAFGFLLIWQCILPFADGWITRNLVEPKILFTHIGMEWLQHLAGPCMYWCFGFMALLGVFVMIGLWYRLSMGLFTVLWAAVYFMQKTVYNNHYYLLLLLCAIMVLLPANAAFSIDSKLKHTIKNNTMPAWCRYIVIAQMAIVYFYAAVAKLYPYWLDGSFTGGILNNAARNYGINFLRQTWLHMLVAYAGIAFDLLIIPALLHRKTRPYAFAAAVFFHLFNSATLHIGIFPYLSLALLVFFFPPESVGKLFFPKRKSVAEIQPATLDSNVLLYVFVGYLIFQLLMPLRHYSIKGDVNWTEEGHRLSWRMMLRKRKGYAQFKIVDTKTGKHWFYDVDALLTPAQKKHMQTKPDMLWQMAQYIHKEYAVKGTDVAIYITCKVTLNNDLPRLLINPTVDMAAAKWNYLGHNDWILLYD